MKQPLSDRNTKLSWAQRTKRLVKYKYLGLLRAKGGPSKVSKGFSIGLAIEMFTLPTLGLAAVLIPPLVYLTRASLPGALIGFMFGKIIYIPLAFLNKQVGSLIVPASWYEHLGFLPGRLESVVKGALDLIIGGMVDGAALGLLIYFPMCLLLDWFARKRREKRKERKAASVILQPQR